MYEITRTEWEPYRYWYGRLTTIEGIKVRFGQKVWRRKVWKGDQLYTTRPWHTWEYTLFPLDVGQHTR